jgi:tripartite ATP-independent transporter DctM subunit
MGTVALPEMERYNYHPRLATGSVAAGGTLGFLIPPSIGFIVYGMLTEQSIGKLLIAGIIPGLMLAVAFIGIIVLMVKINPALAPINPQPVSWHEKLLSLKGIWQTFLIFLVVVGGIYGGLFTPTEAGAIGATALLAVAIIRKRLNRHNLVEALQEALRISVMVLFLVAGANIFSYFLALSTIPMKTASWAASLQVSPYLIHTIIVIIYLFLGCFLDAISMMVLTMPVIFPVILSLGFDPIWFGVIAVLMMEAGLITPPMGLNIYTVGGVAKGVSVEQIFRGVAPFLISIFVVVLFVTIFPKLALLLPGMMLSLR